MDHEFYEKYGREFSQIMVSMGHLRNSWSSPATTPYSWPGLSNPVGTRYHGGKRTGPSDLVKIALTAAGGERSMIRYRKMAEEHTRKLTMAIRSENYPSYVHSAAYSKLINKLRIQLSALDPNVFTVVFTRPYVRISTGQVGVSTRLFKGPSTYGMCDMAVAFVAGLALRRFLQDLGEDVPEVQDRVACLEAKFVVDYAITTETTYEEVPMPE